MLKKKKKKIRLGILPKVEDLEFTVKGASGPN